MSLLPGRRVRWAALGAVACALVMGGIAYASIPGPDGVIHGCYLTNGNLRVIDSAASCKSNETSLNWNQQGVTGPSGPTGATGPTGPTGAKHLSPHLRASTLSYWTTLLRLRSSRSRCQPGVMC